MKQDEVRALMEIIAMAEDQLPFILYDLLGRKMIATGTIVVAGDPEFTCEPMWVLDA